MTGNLSVCRCKKQLLLSFALIFFIFSSGQNPIVTENALTGNPASEWDISGSGSSTLQGFGTDISVNKGQRINFKINTSSVFTYTIKIYRLGYYQGNGARLIANLGTYTGTVQPNPITNTQTGLVDCGNWSVSAFWDVPATAVSGVYIAKLARTSSATTSSHIVFIVRDDASTSDLFFQTSDATWQAYNVYGGNSLYVGATSYPQGHATKVSYNRPFKTRDGGGGGGAMMDWLFNAEYPMIRFIERNGYNVSYTTNVDAARRGNLILNHKIFISNGHDEYWSAEQRNNVEAARNAGVDLAFFSGNEVYWKTRWENSVDGSNTPYRTLVCYKEGSVGEYVCGNKCDPTTAWTGLWREGCSYPSGGGCKPENALTGTISWTESSGAIRVTSEYKNLPFWRNTSVASLASGQSVTLTNGMIGYEWDPENSQYQSSYPANRVILATTSLSGLTYKLSLYTHSSGAMVFGAGTCQWSWGLDNNHDRGNAAASIVAQQATVNLFGDMGALPASLMSGLVMPTAATDNIAPVTIISSPLHGSTLPVNAAVNITGTASDAGGTVSKVEVSVNGGTTWQTASGTTAWTYSWTPVAAGSVNIRVRGTDNSNNVEVPGALGSSNNITVTVTSVPDNIAPVTIISSPLNGASMPTGTPVNITGTASDAGGVVTAVEISVNGGTTWQAATGTTAWTYSWTPATVGSVNIKARGRDNSGNTEVPGALVSSNNITVNVTSAPTTYTIFQPSNTPAIPRENDGQAIELGVKFRTTVNGYVLGIKFYKGAGTTGSHIGNLWSSTGTKLGTGNFTNETSSGWQQVLFTTPVAINANTTYVASYFSSSGDYCSTNPYFTSAIVNGPVKALANGEDGVNGLYRYTATSAFPNSNYQSSNYFADVVFATSLTPTVSAPVLTTQPASQTLCAGSNVTFTSAATGTPTPTVKWQVSINSGSSWADINGATSATLTFAVATGDNSKQYRAVWTNSEGPANSNAATLTVNPVPAAPAVSVVNNCGNSVLTAANYTGTLLWSNSAATSSITVSNVATYTVTQTVSGCTSTAGSGVSAPKIIPSAPAVSVVNNCGISILTASNYTGTLLWSNNETTSSITVANAGTYTVTQTVGECTSITASGIAAPKAIPAAPTVVVADNCGSSTLIAGNYTGTLLWSTNETTPSITVTIAGTYTVAQTVNGCTGSSGSGMAEPVIVSAPAPTVSVVNNCGNSILTAENFTGTLLWSTNETSPSITVLTPGTYTVTQTVGSCPSEPGSGIAAPLISSVPAPAVSVVNNCGSSVLTASGYTGSLLWSTGETTQSITVTTGATYTVTQTVDDCTSTTGSGVAIPGDPLASKPTITTNGPVIFCQGGNVTLTSSLATGNLWSTGATTKSIVVNASGVYSVTNTNAGSCSVASDPVTVIVNPLPAGSISSPTGTVCESEPASVVFNATSGTDPYKVVISGVTYNGVANGATIVTSSTGGTSTSLWPNSTIPSIPLENDGQPIEVGMKFRVSVNGVVKSIRFYKGSSNDAGIYTLKLYLNSSRALLGSVNFSNTTASGWQTVNLPSPVSVTAGTTYMVTYYSASGNYANNLNYFTSARVNGPITGLANNTDGTNGVYRYGSGGGFPTSSYRSSNYWVDVVFSTATNVTLNLTSITDANNCTVSGSLGSITLQAISCSSATFSRSALPVKTEMDIIADNNPEKLQLDQNHPNPFRTSTLIRFGIPSTKKVRLTLFDLNGRVAEVLVDEVKDQGFYTIPMQRRNLGAGVYYYKLEAGEETLIRKMTIF